VPERVNEGGLRAAPALRIDAGQRTAFEDRVAAEAPVALVYNGRSYAVMMATPVDLDDFALGFSLTEGIIADASEFELVDCQRTDAGISLQALIPHARFAALDERRRSLEGRTGCGLCGVESLEAAIRPIARVSPATRVAAGAVARGLALLAERQPLNRASGGVHAAGFVAGDTILVREDVGRHNALDKLAGARARATRADGFLVITSRASYEVVHKAATVGIALVAAISAPTDLAIRLADEAGITLIAFARGDAMTVYTHARGLA
jgi:formate dehydrogenase accessory protein FdhD